MAENVNSDPREMSQRELDDYLDQLIADGAEDTPQFQRAFKIWEKQQ